MERLLTIVIFVIWNIKLDVEMQEKYNTGFQNNLEKIQ